MGLSPQDAAAALHDIQQVERRSATLHGYRQGAPHLIMWGVLWAVGYGLTYRWPGYAQTIWAIVVPIGIVGGFVILRTLGSAVNRIEAWRYGVVAATLCVFFFATFFIMAPVSGRQVGAFIPLFVATVYALTSVWLGLRFAVAVAGVAIAILTLAGFVLLGNHFALWMAGVGGGALILAGFWLRRV
jgi:hypothetical protein